MSRKTARVILIISLLILNIVWLAAYLSHRGSETTSRQIGDARYVLNKYAPTDGGDERLRIMTVKDVIAEMDAGHSFAVYFGFAACPSCQAARPSLIAAAIECDQLVGYVDTRANALWKSNMDIDDYDLFVERFGDYIPLDDNGLKHLYVPHVFFIRDGKIVCDHSGVIQGFDARTDEAGEELFTTLKNIYAAGFAAIQPAPSTMVLAAAFPGLVKSEGDITR